MKKKIKINKNIVFLVYRKWAIRTVNSILKRFEFKKFKIINTQKKFDNFIEHKKDYLIILIGWSNLIKDTTINKNLCIGVHPSDLPKFRGGTPIHNQILQNIKFTKSSLFKLSSKIDEGNIYHKTSLNLEGNNFEKISENLHNSSFKLIYKFLKKFPNNKSSIKTNNKTKVWKRINFKDPINLKNFKKMNTKQLYNIFRSFSHPYPNAFIKDKNGNKLFFLEVKFKPN